MQFSDFIEDCLFGRNEIDWNYYGTALPVKNILRPDASYSFIRQYFSNGEKGVPLLIDPNEASVFLDSYFRAARKEHVLTFGAGVQYELPPERAVHTVSGFFLGLLIEHCLYGSTPLSLESPGHFPFSYLWFLTFLYHDYGYCVAERNDPPIAVPACAPVPNNARPYAGPYSADFRVLRRIMSSLEVSLSPFFPDPPASPHAAAPAISLEHALLRELAQASRLTSRYPCLRFNTGAVICGPRYSGTVVARYFNYCINERRHLDHGIVGGHLFYDRILKNYLSAYLSAQSEARHPLPLRDFHFRGRHFSQDQLPVFSYIADRILVHNLWRQSDDTRALYARYHLSPALGDQFKTVTDADDPLLYLLAIADTLEPTKIYGNIDPKTVARSIRIAYRPGGRALTFSSDRPTVDIHTLHEKAQGLESWTSARCSELCGGAFTLHL